MDELTQKQVEVRARIIARLRNDLFGPREPEEKITTSGNFLESPRSRYLTGIIYPKNTERDASEIDDIIQEARGDSLGTANSIPIINTTLPSSIGLSFFITPEEHNPISLSVDIEGGVYKYHDDDDPEKKILAKVPNQAKGNKHRDTLGTRTEGQRLHRSPQQWTGRIRNLLQMGHDKLTVKHCTNTFDPVHGCSGQ